MGGWIPPIVKVGVFYEDDVFMVYGKTALSSVKLAPYQTTIGCLGRLMVKVILYKGREKEVLILPLTFLRPESNFLFFWDYKYTSLRKVTKHKVMLSSKC